MGREGVKQALIGGCQQDMIGVIILAMKPPMMLFPGGGPHVVKLSSIPVTGPQKGVFGAATMAIESSYLKFVCADFAIFSGTRAAVGVTATSVTGKRWRVFSYFRDLPRPTINCKSRLHVEISYNNKECSNLQVDDSW
jgi:hypothetical protein